MAATDVSEQMESDRRADLDGDLRMSPTSATIDLDLRDTARRFVTEGLAPTWASRHRPSVLDLYIFRRVLVCATAVAACLCLVLLSVQILGMAAFLFTARNVVAVTLKIYLLLMPPMIIIMLPFAVLIAIHRTFDDMHQESELIVMAAIGRSRGQRAAPAIVAAGLLSAICLCLSVFIEPYTNKMADRLKAGISVDILEHAAETGGFKKIGDNLLIQIGRLAPDGSLADVLIVDMRSADTENIYFAKRARLPDPLAGNVLLLSDGELLIKNHAAKFGSRVQFSTYAFSLADFLPRNAEVVTQPQSNGTAELLAGCGSSCSAGEQPAVARELHRRFSDWLYVMSFAAMTAWFGSRSRPNRGIPRFGIVGTIVLGIVIRGFGFVALNGSGTSSIAAILVYLIPVSVLILFPMLVYCDGSYRAFERSFERANRIVAGVARVLLPFGRAIGSRYRSRF